MPWPAVKPLTISLVADVVMAQRRIRSMRALVKFFSSFSEDFGNWSRKSLSTLDRQEELAFAHHAHVLDSFFVYYVNESEFRMELLQKKTYSDTTLSWWRFRAVDNAALGVWMVGLGHIPLFGIASKRHIQALHLWFWVVWAILVERGNLFLPVSWTVHISRKV